MHYNQSLADKLIVFEIYEFILYLLGENDGKTANRG